MRAAVLKGPRKIQIEEVPDPKPGSNEVLIRMKYCGICGSDLHFYESPHTPPGSIMGHEWAGEVVEVGPDVTLWSVGDRVWPGGEDISDMEWTPEYGWDQELQIRDSYVKDMGGYGEIATYHERAIAATPEEVPDLDACMADQAATALGGIRSAKMQIGESVLIIGAGPIGLWSLRCAQLAGARATCIAELIEGRVQKAQTMGADLVVNPSKGDVRMQVSEFFGGYGADVVLECGGTESALQLAIDLARPGGRIAQIGLSNEPLKINVWNLVVKAVELYGVIHIDMEAGMEIIRQNKVDTKEFLSEVITLDQAPDAIERLLHPDTEEKIIIKY
jgi:2-desacetyl-2-hydroxyethyl bacteriochlorophyllide A dehydrogenase